MPPSDSSSLPHESNEDAIVVEFLRMFAEDRDANRTRTLQEYQARFPGFEASIAGEYAHLRCASPSTTGSDVSHEGEWTMGRLARALQTDRYETIEQIGRGGMGVVSRVRDQRLQRDLAMKVLAAQGGQAATDGSASWRRFLDEAQITGQLAHPGVVPVHDIGIDAQGRAFFTMDLIRGDDFRRVIARVHDAGDTEWTLTRAIQIVIRVCEAVAYAHANGVIHRDLKPANVMVGGFGETYVLDWGLARVGAHASVPGDDEASESATGSHTLAGDVLGTPAFMAPEQARGELESVDALSDVYSIGAILYHLLAGRPPYAESGRARDVLERLLAGPPEPIAAAHAEVAPELIAICEKAMHRERGERYESVAALAEDLRAFVELRVVHAYEAGAVAEARKWIRRNRPLAWTGFAALLALVAGLVFSVVQKDAADAQARRADANSEIASDAVEQMMTRLGAWYLADAPGLSELRRDILLDAVEFRRNLDDGSDAASVELGKALVILAKVQNTLDEFESIDRRTQEAIERLAPARPDGSPFGASRKHIVEAHSVRGSAALDQEQFDRAQLEFETAMQLCDRWEGDPPDASMQRVRQKVLTSFGALFERQRDWERALDVYARAAELGLSIVQENPGRPEDRSSAGLAHENLARVLIRERQWDEAEAVLRKADDLLSVASDGHPSDRSRRLHLASVRLLNGRLHRDRGRFDAARESSEVGLRIHRALADEFPGVPQYRAALGIAAGDYASILGPSGAIEEATALVEEAIEQLDVAVDLAPANLRYRRARGDNRRTYCGILLSRGDWTQCGVNAARLGEDSPIAGAIYLALSASAACAVPTVGAEERAEVIDEYGQAAAELLDRAFQSTEDVRGALMVLQKSELDVFRAHSHFVELERRLRARTK